MMKTFSRMLLLGSSAAVLIAATVSAQGQGATEDELATVVVTGSRISLQGYQAPTPVTTIGVEQLNRDAKVSIGDAIRELPSVGPSVSPNNGGNSGNASQGDAGIDTINLRNLGIARTLILFDGQRIVSSNLFGGGVDLSTIPSSLIQRVEVVTAGASAAYGSDAVAGVVNLILNKNFTGFKANAQFSDAGLFDHRQGKLEASWGTPFAGDRGQVILSGTYTKSPDTVFNGQTKWWNNTQLVLNPAATAANGLPIYVHQANVGNAQYTQGGLVTGSTANTASGLALNALRGTQFTGPNGTPVPFNFGTLYNNTTCYNGCSADDRTNTGRFGILAVPYNQQTVFGYVGYQVTPSIKASLQLNYGRNSEENVAALRLSANTIYADNPYLDPAVAARLGPITINPATGRPNQTLTVGTQNLNNMDPNEYTLNNLCTSVGQPCNVNHRALRRGVFSLEGELGEDWSWNAYVQRSGIQERQHVYNNTITDRYNFAVDAVRVTTANVGTSGLPLGSIQCRARLTGNPAAAGCQPLNTLGTGVVSRDAYLYLNPGQDPKTGIVDDETIILNQSVVAGSMQGVLPWGLPAGHLAVAFGAEYRAEDGGVTQANPLGTPTVRGAAPGWAAGNFRTYYGKYHTKEGFVEVDAPLLKDSFVQSLNFNAAGRVTDYSTSGLVKTWKLGLTSQLNDDIRLRATWSFDIRAPLISDLFSPGILASQTCNRFPLATTPNYQCFRLQRGNADLEPEKAHTVSAGVVLTPHWVPGLALSADWYTINIAGSIFITNYQTVLDRCRAGDTFYCTAIALDSTGRATQVDEFPLNAASERISGVDVQANYSHGLLAGLLDLRLVGNYAYEQERTALDVTYDSAGALGASPDSYAASQPKARGTLSATYTQGPWSVTAQGRFVGPAKLSNGVQGGGPGLVRASLSSTGALTTGTIEGVVDDNSIPSVLYGDLRASYSWNDKLQIYGALDNVADTQPPGVPSTGGAGGTNALVYDAIGRVWRMGVRVSF
jgi:iron complex outermembrane receptor protein